MPNQTLLAGMACPDCGSEGPFRIDCRQTLTIHDDSAGDEENGDVTWSDGSFCQCLCCPRAGLVRDFYTNTDTNTSAKEREA